MAETSGVFVWRFTSEHFAARASEWLLTLVLFNLGVGMSVQPEMFTLNPSFAGLASIAPQGVWAVGLLVTSIVRLAALVINGAWRRSPYFRAVTALLSAFVWWTLLLGILQSNLPGLGIAFYVPMVAFDLYNVYRAMKDAGAAETAHGAA